MKYADVRNTLKTGDLLAWSSGDWKSWHGIEVNLVRMFTRSEFSHVGVCLVLAGRVFVLEAVGAGVRIFPLSRELPFFLIRKPTTLTDEQIEWAFSKLGAKYESKIAMVINFFRKIGLGENERWQCSEYVTGIYGWKGVEPTPAAVVSIAMDLWQTPLESIE